MNATDRALNDLPAAKRKAVLPWQRGCCERQDAKRAAEHEQIELCVELEKTTARGIRRKQRRSQD